MSGLHALDGSRCQGDGICVEVCSKQVLALVDGKARTVADCAHRCFGCGQCVAAGPTGALSLEGRAPDDAFPPLACWGFGFDELKAFLASRRSVRAFKPQPVDFVATVCDADSPAGLRLVE